MKHYAHPTLPIEAPREYWAMLGYTVYTDDSVGGGPHDGNELLALALANGRSQEEAIAWALAERQRRKEAAEMASAMRQEGAGLTQLAEAIQSTSEDEFIRKLLGRLTERTQYAVRQQLGKVI